MIFSSFLKSDWNVDVFAYNGRVDTRSYVEQPYEMVRAFRSETTSDWFATKHRRALG